MFLLSKTLWYLTRPNHATGKHTVLAQYGGFTTATQANSIMWRQVECGPTGILERVPGFEYVEPVRASYILSHLEQFEEYATNHPATL